MRTSVSPLVLRRLRFLILNAALLVVGYGAVVQPALSLLANEQERISESRFTLRRLQAIEEKSPEVETFAKEVREEAKRGDFVIGANEGVINANLQARLKTHTETSGARVQSIRTLPVRIVSNVNFIGARLEISGTLKAVHSTLAAIEGGAPLLFVSAAILKPATHTRINAADETLIDAQFDIHGLAQRREEK
jgi:VIT1/CCC1 family predicted Fe2+/Mn2+ transporter